VGIMAAAVMEIIPTYTSRQALSIDEPTPAPWAMYEAEKALTGIHTPEMAVRTSRTAPSTESSRIGRNQLQMTGLGKPFVMSVDANRPANRLPLLSKSMFGGETLRRSRVCRLYTYWMGVSGSMADIARPTSCLTVSL